MIDYAPEPGLLGRRFRTVGHFINNLPRWLCATSFNPTGDRWRHSAGRKLTSLLGRMFQPVRSDTMQDATFAAREMFDHLELPAAHTELIIDHLDAFYRYQPTVYDGRVLLFWARCRPLFHSLAPGLGWEHYAAHGFDRVIVSCNHDNILKSPHVREIASRLDSAIRDQEADPSEELRRHVG
jgi:thioesterase domain-containing protein